LTRQFGRFFNDIDSTVVHLLEGLIEQRRISVFQVHRQFSKFKRTTVELAESIFFFPFILSDFDSYIQAAQIYRNAVNRDHCQMVDVIAHSNEID
jgi:hypothetical protein